VGSEGGREAGSSKASKRHGRALGEFGRLLRERPELLDALKSMESSRGLPRAVDDACAVAVGAGELRERPRRGGKLMRGAGLSGDD